MRSPKKPLIVFVGIIAIPFLYFTSAMLQFFEVPLVEKGVVAAVKVYPSQSAAAVSDDLVGQKILKYPTLFQWLVQISGKELRFGEYQIRYPITGWQLLKNMFSGRGLVRHRLTIIEGWTFNNIRDAIKKDDNFQQTILAQTNQAVMSQLGSSRVHPEGLFYPDTYFFTWENTDMSVLKTAYLKMKKTLNAAWENRAPNLPYKSPYDALIVASLIERETALPAEKPIIASVILNRLNKNMRLQIDPTVQYGVDKKFNEPITKQELTTKTPYNTYQMTGLPPTPICMPSKTSIEAALHPASTNYFYYVANGKGGHTFSATYAEHEKAVAVYRAQAVNAAPSEPRAQQVAPK